MNKDTPITVTLRKIEWTHILAAITEQRHDTQRSPLIRQRYGEIGKSIRDQIEEQSNQQEENK